MFSLSSCLVVINQRVVEVAKLVLDLR